MGLVISCAIEYDEESILELVREDIENSHIALRAPGHWEVKRKYPFTAEATFVQDMPA